MKRSDEGGSGRRCPAVRASKDTSSGVVAALFGVLLLTGCGDAPLPDPQLRLPVPSEPLVDPWLDVGGWEVESRVLYGSPSGPLTFGSITDIAVRDDGMLAVADASNCSIMFVDRTEQRFLDRIGRCGSGPGEFRQVGAIAFRGDSLLVYDRGTHAVVTLDARGEEVSRIQTRLPEGAFVWKLHSVTARTAVVGLERVRTSWDSDGPLFLAAELDLREGSIEEGFVADVPKAREGSRNRLRRKPLCVARSEGNPSVVVMNDWIFEGIHFVRGDGSGGFHFLSQAPLRPRLTRTGEWIPAVLAGVGCGGSGALFKTTEASSSGSGTRETLMEFRAYDGVVLLRQIITDPESLLHGRLGRMHGDTLFMISSQPGHPVVGEFVVRPSQR